MSGFGSVFLGDNQRFRMLSSTPPSSPTVRSPVPIFPMRSPSQSPKQSISKATAPPPVIDAALSLELRLRWLEAIILGARQDAQDRKGKDKLNKLEHGETLISLAEDVQQRLDAAVESNDGLKRFMNHYDQHAHLLTPAFALSGSASSHAPSYENMSSSELEAFLTEMEPDIRAADRDMREIEILEKKGVTNAGKLPNYEALRPRLKALIHAHTEDIKQASSLEKRIAAIMERHATHVDALSELFVAWDDTITEVEDKVAKLERKREERQRMGYQ